MNKLLGVVLATILVLLVSVVPVSAETVNGINATSRLAGQDHYQTSVAIAEAYNHNGDCGNVILASGDSFPDALSASILSKKMNAPILLVGSTVNASSDTFNYLYTHASQQRGNVYIVGGTGVIGPDFETKLASMGYSNIKRLGGTDRYDTNMLLVNEVNVTQGTPVFIASGENFPDALSISSFSGSKQYPTLLVGVDYLPDKTKGYLLNEKPSAVYIAGGTSVVSQDIENQINALVPGATVTRLAGDDRFGTNAAVINEFSSTPDTIYLANGDDFPNVLAGSALAAKTGNPIILVDNQLSTLPSAAEAYLNELNDSGIQANSIALGGTDVVSDDLIQQFENAFYADRKIPFLPLDYKNVDNIQVTGNANKIYSEKYIMQIVKIINGIKSYESIDIPVYHSTPAPNLSLMITTKENKYIMIYEDYDLKDKISDGHTSYIINHSAIEQIFSNYVLDN
ncbi:MAG: cell wall-binding repeat-containing protein [Desulfosporosinus sp.]|nr:cell wall-binding repeat-containing protein [Desulfosporosinus sp.]